MDRRIAVVAVLIAGVEAVAVVVARRARVGAIIRGFVAVIDRALVAVVAGRGFARQTRIGDRIAALGAVAEQAVIAARTWAGSGICSGRRSDVAQARARATTGDQRRAEHVCEAASEPSAAAKRRSGS